MTLSTSDVAVCCSSDSVRSRVRACTSSNSRTLLDRDRCLVGKDFQKPDLVVGKTARLRPCDKDRAHNAIFAMHGHSKAAAVPGLFGESPIVISRINEDVADVNNCASVDGLGCHRHAIKWHRKVCPEELDAALGNPANAREFDNVAIEDGDNADLCVTQLLRTLSDEIEDRHCVGRRSTYYVQHVSSRGLPLQRLLRLVEQPHVLDGDHGLIGEGLQQGNLFVAERMYFGAAEQNRSDALALAQQGNTQISASAGAARPFPGVGEFVAFGGEHVVYVH